MSKQIYLSQPEFPEALLPKITEFLKNPDLSGSSASTKEFEQKISALSGNGHTLGLSNGTSAIHLALILLGVKPGDDVACQSFTFCATANPIAYMGAKPVFIDSELETWNMCPDTLREYLSVAKSINRMPKAIIYVHTYGMPAKVNELIAVAEEFEVPLIEDAAEAIGSKYMGSPVGQFGAMSIFSFNGNKIASTSGGGVLLSASKELIDRAAYLATQARANDQFEHDEVGYNYRIGALNALVGSVQLDYIDEVVSARRKRFDDYKEGLVGVADIEWQPEMAGNFSNRWLTTLLFDHHINPRDIIEKFEQHNIEVKRLWKPLHLQKSFSGTKFFGSGTCVELWERGLCLPSGKLPGTDDLESVIEIIKESCR
jgi:dTDP-4-amino-4,6-dideoxygalactose transaminase